MLLQVMPFATDVGDYLLSAGQSDFRDLSQRRVRLLRRRRIDTRTNTPALRTALQRRNIAFPPLALTGFPHQLIDGCHARSPVVLNDSE